MWNYVVDTYYLMVQIFAPLIAKSSNKTSLFPPILKLKLLPPSLSLLMFPTFNISSPPQQEKTLLLRSHSWY